MSSLVPILVAIPDEWNSFVCDYLKTLGFPVVATCSKAETLETLQTHKEFLCAIIVSDWAMSTQGSSANGIIELLREKMPTVTIITETSRHQSGYRYMDEVFFPPNHEYVTSPFDVEELVARLRNMGVTP